MKEFEYMFAPMEGYSNPTLRQKCYEQGATSTFTEMSRLSALARGNKSTWEKIKIPLNIPTYIQIVGAKEKELKKFLEAFTPAPGFLGFNFNLGCPSPDIIKCGLGCALIKRISKVQSMVNTVKSHGYSASLKLRLGMNQYEKEKKTYLNLIREVDADFFIVHGRHGKEREKDKNDFSVYPECVKTNKVIIANGDVTSADQITYLKSIGVRGAMIGRAAVANPHIFSILKQ